MLEYPSKYTMIVVAIVMISLLITIIACFIKERRENRRK